MNPMDKKSATSQSLAEAITKSASKQTYYTIRWLADGKLAADAYRAYAYFRWVDDVLDAEAGSMSEKVTFVNRQKSLLDACYRGETKDDLTAEERILFDLVCNDQEVNSGLQSYLRNMMAVMIFDVNRRDRVISQVELSEYSHKLATAVTEAIYHFIGHGQAAPEDETRYYAVTAAHIIHMLRDALDDTETGYFNIPGEYLQAHDIAVQDLQSQAYRRWVCRRIKLARRYFNASRVSHSQIKNLRCRLASYAYTARFEWLLRTIERENYCLRPEYPERKSLKAGIWMAWSILVSVFLLPLQRFGIRTQVAEPIQARDR
jgi:hypothetical protein